MPRKPFPYSTANPYHITARSHNKEHFYLPLEEVWKVLSNALRFGSYCFDLKIHSFVLMPNHYHLILTAPNQNVSEFMQYFQRQSSREINMDSFRINQVWGSRFHRSEIEKYIYFLNAYKYVYQNPVRAKLSVQVEHYPFSSLRGVLGLDHLWLPVVDDFIDYTSMKSHLEWLNKKIDSTHLESMRRAMKKKKFKYPKNDSRENELEHILI